jgi:hypothetical protein
MRYVFLALSIFVAACGNSSKPDTEQPVAPDTVEPDGPDGEEAVLTPEECEASGGTVVGDIGDGKAKCPDHQETAKVSGGVEQILCCLPDFSE